MVAEAEEGGVASCEGGPAGLQGYLCHQSISQGDTDVRTPRVLVIMLIPGARASLGMCI